jgi:hypothetical protein
MFTRRYQFGGPKATHYRRCTYQQISAQHGIETATALGQKPPLGDRRDQSAQDPLEDQARSRPRAALWGPPPRHFAPRERHRPRDDLSRPRRLRSCASPGRFEVINGSGEELVRNAITSVRRNRVALKGNLRNVIDDAGFIAPNVLIRARLDLFVYVIHYRTYEEVHSKVPGLNLIILRQNTEGEYAMLEHGA